MKFLLSIFGSLVLLGLHVCEAKGGKGGKGGGAIRANGKGGNSLAFRVALWGDMPYVGQTVGVFDQTNGTEYAENSYDNCGDYYTDLVNCINAQEGNLCNTTELPAFAWFAGDMVSGASPCTLANYDRFEGLANIFLVPSLYVLGDNEWTDCWKPKTGEPHDPLVQLNYVKRRFFDKSGKSFLGYGSMQTINGGDDHPDYQTWEYNGVTFIGVTVVGSNNGFYDNNEDIGKECDPSQQIFDPGCVRSNAEFKERNSSAISFLQAAFKTAKKSAGVMVMIQANMWGEYDDPCDSNITLGTGHVDFYNALMAEVTNFNGQVALINGDTHVYAICNESPDNPMNLPGYGYVPNFVSIRLPGSINIGWVDAVIDPSADPVFSFTNHYFTPPPYIDP